MSQPTFTDGPPVPLMVERYLDQANLPQLFSDLFQHASIIEVRKKGGLADYSGAVETTLDALLAELQSGARALPKSIITSTAAIGPTRSSP